MEFFLNFVVDFFDMFPSCHLHPLDSLTVITFCQKPADYADTKKKLAVDTQLDVCSFGLHKTA